jgi:hypothetical protein
MVKYASAIFSKNLRLQSVKFPIFTIAHHATHSGCFCR